MTTPSARHGGRGAKFDRAEALRLREQEPPWTYRQIAEHYGVSEQAARQGILKYQKEQQLVAATGKVAPASSWPWVLATEHSKGDALYQKVLALRKQREGQSLSARAAREAQELLMFITRGNLAITYHRSLGFTFTPRLPEDGDEYFVARSPEWWERYGYAAA